MVGTVGHLTLQHMAHGNHNFGGGGGGGIQNRRIHVHGHLSILCSVKFMVCAGH